MTVNLNASLTQGFGITSDTSGVLTFQSNAAETMRIDTSGNVGIGTTSPSGAKLDIISGLSGTTAGSNVVAKFQTNGNGYDAEILLGDSVNSSARLGYLSGNMYFWTAGAERMRIDTSGNVGIGTTSPISKLHVNSTGATATYAIVGNSNGGSVFGVDTTGASYVAGYASKQTIFGNYNSGGAFQETMRLDSSGNLLVGRTSTVSTPASTACLLYVNSGISSTDGTNTTTYFTNGLWFNTSAFRVYNGSNVGVYINTGATSWTASSDERKKDIIEPITDAANKVSSLRAVIGKYKTDDEGTRRSFLIAQDVQAVLPEAVDATDSDNLGVSYTEVIPLLVAAIKEQQSIIFDLQSRIAALEAK